MRDQPDSTKVTEESLDPADWAELRDVAHRAIDDAIEHLRGLPDRPPWRDMPPEVRAFFNDSAPQDGQPLSEVYADLQTNLFPFPMGNIHPRFWGWYMGAGNFPGALGDFLAAIDGSNLGGGNTAAAQLDRQVVDWLRRIAGFPPESGGTLTSGGSAANLVCHAVARQVQSGIDIRRLGVAALKRPLVFYGSDQTHSCHRKALEILGLGAQALRLLPSDGDFRLRLDALETAVAEDHAAGRQPACVIGNAGTVNTGAIDDLAAIATFCREQGLWFHVDGCIGAFLALSPDHAPMIAGMAQADSLALDPHKWLHAPFEAGCALIRDRAAHYATFALHPEYLEEKPRGVAGAEYLFDYGIELSRGFKALKVWIALKHFGTRKFGRLVAQNIAQARYLSARIDGEPRLERLAPVPINIVCFRYRRAGLDAEALKAINTEIMLQLQEDGIAVLTDTTIRGGHALRVAINNHRTRRTDLDLLIAEIIRRGDQM